jgi:hypothetical protein
MNLRFYLFDQGIDIRNEPPFTFLDWSAYYKCACVLVTANADSPYLRSLRSGHERYVIRAGCLSDEEFKTWIQNSSVAEDFASSKI